jgi:hypothetical protein
MKPLRPNLCGNSNPRSWVETPLAGRRTDEDMQRLNEAYHLAIADNGPAYQEQLKAEPRYEPLLEIVGHPRRVWCLTAWSDFEGQGAGTMNYSWFVWDAWHAPYSISRTLACLPAHLRDAAPQYEGELEESRPAQQDPFS